MQTPEHLNEVEPSTGTNMNAFEKASHVAAGYRAPPLQFFMIRWTELHKACSFWSKYREDSAVEQGRASPGMCFALRCRAAH